MSQADGQPRLEAWLDTDGENDQVHVRVSADGTEYERVDADLETLLQTEQFLSMFQRPALALLSIWERTVETDVDREDTETHPEVVDESEVA